MIQWLKNLFKSSGTSKRKSKKLALQDMAKVYEILKPYLDRASTFDELLRLMFDNDVNSLNVLFQLLTGDDPTDVEGYIIILTILSALRENELGSFVALMKRKVEPNGSN